MLRAAYACCRQPTACRLLSPSHAWAALAGHQLSAALLGAAATAAVSPARQLQTTALASTRSSRLPALLQEPAPSPKSALESAAVILKAHAEVLQRAGLSKAAAYAVAKVRMCMCVSCSVCTHICCYSCAREVNYPLSAQLQMSHSSVVAN